MKRPIRHSFITIILLFFLHGCFLDNPPTKEQVIGTWVSADSAKLIFRNDGSFSGFLLPAEYLLNWDYAGQRFNGYGSWHINKEYGFYDIDLNFDHTKLNTTENGLVTHIFLSHESRDSWNLFLWKGKEGEERYEFNKINLKE